MALQKKSAVEIYAASLGLRDSRKERYYLKITGENDLGQQQELLSVSKTSTGAKIFRDTVKMAKEMGFGYIIVSRYDALDTKQDPSESITVTLDEQRSNEKTPVDRHFEIYGGLSGFLAHQEAQSRSQVEKYTLTEKLGALTKEVEKLSKENEEKHLDLKDFRAKNEELQEKLREQRHTFEDRIRDLERNHMSEMVSLEKRANLWAGLGSGIEKIGSNLLAGLAGFGGMNGNGEIAGTGGMSGTAQANMILQPEVELETVEDSEDRQIIEISEKIKKWLLANPVNVAEKVRDVIGYMAKDEASFNQLAELIKITE